MSLSSGAVCDALSSLPPVGVHSRWAFTDAPARAGPASPASDTRTVAAHRPMSFMLRNLSQLATPRGLVYRGRVPTSEDLQFAVVTLSAVFFVVDPIAI